MRLLIALVAAWPVAAVDDAEFFESKIRPLLATNCHSCHTEGALGGLRLDSREGLLKGGKSGVVVVPGKPEDSLLMQAVRRTHIRLKMPPVGAQLRTGKGVCTVLRTETYQEAVWVRDNEGGEHRIAYADLPPGPYHKCGDCNCGQKPKKGDGDEFPPEGLDVTPSDPA